MDPPDLRQARLQVATPIFEGPLDLLLGLVERAELDVLDVPLAAVTDAYLVELAAMGDVELAEGCRTAFRQYVTITRRGPDKDARRIADHKPNDLRPKDGTYWQKRGDRAVDIGHAFKYPYSYYNLMRRANDPELKQSFEAKAYHIF